MIHDLNYRILLFSYLEKKQEFCDNSELLFCVSPINISSNNFPQSRAWDKDWHPRAWGSRDVRQGGSTASRHMFVSGLLPGRSNHWAPVGRRPTEGPARGSTSHKALSFSGWPHSRDICSQAPSSPSSGQPLLGLEAALSERQNEARIRGLLGRFCSWPSGPTQGIKARHCQYPYYQCSYLAVPLPVIVPGS